MPVYGERFTKRQREALEEYEALSGFEPMLQDDFDAGAIGFRDLWKKNVSWLEDVVAGVSNINTDDCTGRLPRKIVVDEGVGRHG